MYKGHWIHSLLYLKIVELTLIYILKHQAVLALFMQKLCQKGNGTGTNAVSHRARAVSKLAEFLQTKR